jgi:hypothetical protein
MNLTRGGARVDGLVSNNKRTMHRHLSFRGPRTARYSAPPPHRILGCRRHPPSHSLSLSVDSEPWPRPRPPQVPRRPEVAHASATWDAGTLTPHVSHAHHPSRSSSPSRFPWTRFAWTTQRTGHKHEHDPSSPTQCTTRGNELRPWRQVTKRDEIHFPFLEIFF